MRFDFQFFVGMFPDLIKKIPITLYFGVISFVLALFLGFVLAAMRKSRYKIVKLFAQIYISFFRGTPYITQLFILYYGIPYAIPALVKLPASFFMITTIAMNSAAFIAEIIRGALLSVSKDQREAALSLGFSKWEMAKEIVIPQAAVTAFPALSNAFISMVKMTSVGFTVGIVELMSTAKIISARSFHYLEGYLAVGLIYWILVILMSKLQDRIERRLGRYL